MSWGVWVTGAGGWLSMFHTDQAFRTSPVSGSASKLTRIQATVRFAPPTGMVNSTRQIR
jgi:hypothetical protein